MRRILVATDLSSRADRAVLGGVAAEVLRQVSCDTLTVPVAG